MDEAALQRTQVFPGLVRQAGPLAVRA